MGFDNECILNIQSLAGEYFCPVCRLLVYPNEALQSQCTHLYCKPCLTYVVSTTRVCPYDGYLVTEADSKPLIEANKSLAETIGKIAVHCLFHRSGCIWKGSLSDCTSHCTGCAFGNSAVVCNRCGTQIMHRQVQEHALTCPGIAASATGTATTADQTQAAAVTSQAQPSQTAVATPGKDLNQQSISSSQAHPVVQAAVPTPEQWYQQQQQLYQQYYQQYPGHDPSQQQYQHYYPYQQAAVPQYQQHAHASNATGQLQPRLPQLQLQPQTQPQPQLSQSQPQASHIQAAVATQPQNQTQVVPPHSQIQSQTYPPTPGQPYPQPQSHQQSQLQAQPHTPPSQPRSLSQAQLLGQLQPNPQPNQPPTANFQSQTQQPSAHVVTGHHSFPQSQNPVLQSQLPKQAPLMRPPHSHATTASQTRPALLPSPGQVQNTPPAQQQSVQQPYLQQPGQPVHQRPNMQPVQQTFLHQHYVQQQPMPSQLRPTGQSHLFPPQTHAYSQPTVQHAKSPNLVGGRSMPNLGVQAQPNSQHAGGVMRPSYPGTNQQAPNQSNMLKTNIQMQLPSEQQSGENSRATMYERQGNHIFEKGTARQEVEASSLMPANVRDVKTEKSETDLKSTNLEHKSAEDKAEQTSETYLSKGDSFLQKKSPLKAVERHEGQGGNLVMEAVSGFDGGSKGVPVSSAQILSNPAPGGEVKSSNPHGFQDKSRPQVSGVEFQGFPHSSQVQAHQLPGPPSLLHVPPPGPPHQTQGPGAPQIHFRPQLPGHPLHPHDGIPGSALPFERGPSQSGLGQQSSELQSVAPQGPYNRGPSGASRFSQGQGSVLLPPHAFDSHGGTMARAAPHGPEIFPNQRPNFMDSRGFDPYGPVGSRDERFNPFPAGSNYRPEFEDDLRQFPRPYDRGPHGLKFDTGLKMDSGVGSVSSRFLSPYNGGGANDAGECLGGHHEDTFGRMDPTCGQLDFMGPGPGYDRHHMDSWGSRSPGRELPGISSRGFRGPGPDDIHGRESGRFGEPFGSSFHESRFPMLPSHRRWGEFEGPHNMGRGEHLRNDFIGSDNFAGPFRWREHLGGPHGRSPLGEPIGFGAHPRHSRIREMGGPGSFDPFGRGDGSSFPRFGEPGFRSRFSPHGFPTDDGIFTRDLAFDKSRKRKPPAMGWCRICKVDCETVEGLDLHSQTREHQKMAMDMVVTIKQNSKKKKLAFGDQSSLGDASQPRSAGSEGHGKNN